MHTHTPHPTPHTPHPTQPPHASRPTPHPTPPPTPPPPPHHTLRSGRGYHRSCLKLAHVPEEEWQCQFCAAPPAAVGTKRRLVRVTLTLTLTLTSSEGGGAGLASASLATQESA